MLTLLLAAASLSASQPHAPVPEPTSFVIYGDYGRPGALGNIQRLVEEWRGEGTVHGTVRRAPLSEAAACVGRRHDAPIDADCIRRLNPSRPGQAPVVAIVARDAGRVIPVLNITCIGPAVSPTVEANMNHGGAFSRFPQVRSEIRENVARCIATAGGPAIDWAATGSGTATSGAERPQASPQPARPPRGGR